MTRRFSASSAAQFMACPGSANLELSIPGWVEPVRDDTAGAKGVGTIIHDLLATIGAFTPSGMDHLISAISYVRDLTKGRRFTKLIEVEAVADWLPSKPTTTVDLVLYTQTEMHIIDYKTGKIEVEALDNQQLMFYLACFYHLAPDAKWYTLHVVQPWAKTGSSTHVVTRDELHQFMQEAIAADVAIMNKSTLLVPSDHCTFCPANPHSRGDKGSPLCPVMLNKLYPMDADEDEILAL